MRSFGLPVESAIRLDAEEKEVRNVYVNFNSKEGVDTLMNNRPFVLHRQTLVLSRSNPKGTLFVGEPITTISIKIYGNERKELSEHQLKRYFQPFGIIKACQRLNDQRILMEFAE